MRRAKRSGPRGEPARMARKASAMTDSPAVEALSRENRYLKQRNAQLQDDVTALGAEVERLRQILERARGRAGAASNPLAGRD
jgi:predicted  nucleic acid-binding Zn-ribbon protein